MFVLSQVLRPKLFLIVVVALAIVAAVSFLLRHHNQHSLDADTAIDRIVIEKSARQLSIFRGGKKLKTYLVALGRDPMGPKEQEGDMKTPEGIYKIDNHKPDSAFHLALHISYPSAGDTARAAARGVSAGCDIMIHGLPNGAGWLGPLHRQKDWTAGCIALTNEEIEELYRVTPDGTIVEINP